MSMKRLWTTCIGLLVLAGAIYGQQTTPPVAKEAEALWQQMRRADVNSREFATAKETLETLIDSLRPNQRVPVATAMMKRGADDLINAAALQMFGQAGLPAADLKPIVENPERSWPQRVLVRTYYKFLRPEYETRLNEETRREMLQLLADRLKALAPQQEVSYGEQRLLVHMLESALSRYAGDRRTVPEAGAMVQAMRAYIGTTRQDDPLGAAMTGWLEMIPLADPQTPPTDTAEEALVALGHWLPQVRMRAAARLGMLLRKDEQIGEQVLAMLKDPRDEARAAAASVFSFALSYKPDQIIPAMVKLLVWDRGVAVQHAASETLIAHSQEAQMAVGLLLAALEDRRPLPGPKRTTSILQTLSYLVHTNTQPSLKRRLLDAAVRYLRYAPDGALRALEALGSYAKPAVPQILEYRNVHADRFRRQQIDRHVLQSIDPSAVQE